MTVKFSNLSNFIPLTTKRTKPTTTKKQSVTFAKTLLLISAHASETGNWFVEHDRSLSVPLNITF